MGRPNEIQSKTIDRKDKTEQQGVKDVYIGVFFDGTNNNMVRKRGEVADGLINPQFKYEEKSITAADFNKLDSRTEKFQTANVYNSVKPNLSNGYSNIAILYYMSKKEKTRDNINALFHSLYIEGSGATDASSKLPMNINGLGFGLGETGVVALVSKAVKYVVSFIEIHKPLLNDIVNVHFFVYGFSRGSACARLFSHLVTRDKGSKLPQIRENEFSKYYAKKYYSDGSLHFLDGDLKVYSNLKLQIEKTVDYLGIYDTVASIGFLMQKDGWVNPIGEPYRYLSEEYDNNWHYKNVTEYGLFISEKVKKTCHICALDEFRENFALTDVGINVNEKKMEVFIPGCHSDVGGGYFDGDKNQEYILRTVVEKGEQKDLESPQKRTDSSCAFKVTIGPADFDDDTSNSRDSVKAYPVTVFLDNPQKAPDYEIPTLGESNSKRKNDLRGIRDTDRNAVSKEYPNLLGEYSLGQLGWIDKDDDGKQLELKIYSDKNKYETKKVPTTIRVMDEERLVFKRDSVMFKKNTKSGYSNIPLMLQYNRMDEVELEILGKVTSLFEKIPVDYNVPTELSMMAGNMETEILGKWGKRLFLIPKGGYSGTAYRTLRLKYIHFTSTDNTVGHFNAPWKKGDANFFEGSAGNIANPPNMDLQGRICRIVYHGDENDNTLNYMYDYGIDAVPIECGTELLKWK